KLSINFSVNSGSLFSLTHRFSSACLIRFSRSLLFFLLLRRFSSAWPENGSRICSSTLASFIHCSQASCTGLELCSSTRFRSPFVHWF
ncbi:hypothetical protein VIGAN_06098600, partial [Vigna angularis var. angularis]